MKIETMTLREIADLLYEDGYDNNDAIARAVRINAKRGTLVWTRAHVRGLNPCLSLVSEYSGEA